MMEGKEKREREEKSRNKIFMFYNCLVFLYNLFKFILHIKITLIKFNINEKEKTK